MSELDEIADNLAGQVKANALELMGDESYCLDIWKAVRQRLPRHAGPKPLVAADVADGKGRWLARVTIYDGEKSLAADTQLGDDMADAEPLEFMPTLKAVAEWGRDLAIGYTADLRRGEVSGLDDITLEGRIKSIRVQLSRTGRRFTWWRLPFAVGGEQWQMNIQVGKATPEQIAAGPPPPSKPFRHSGPDRTTPPPAFPGAESQS